MRCRNCTSVMVIDHCESGTGATTCWYACSLCGTVRLTSEPDTGGLAATGVFADDSPDPHVAEDDSGYAGEPLNSVPELET